MRLNELARGLMCKEIGGNPDGFVCGIACNAAKVKSGFCFFAIKGTKTDGHEFIGEAISRGAIAIVSESPIRPVAHIRNIVVDDVRCALALMSSRFYGEPSKSLRLLGITGTNGKTTTTYLLEAIFKEAGCRTGVIGTVSHRYGEISSPASHTTPEPHSLQSLLAEMVRSRVEVCVMEVSSHALVQSRVKCCHFDAAAFTNLSQDHLDYHGEMDEYFRAKSLLFDVILPESSKQAKFAAVNADDPFGRRIIGSSRVATVSFGFDDKSSVRCPDFKFGEHGIEMSVLFPQGRFELKSKLFGRFNASNILAATAVALKMGVPIDVLARAISKMGGVPGRFERIDNDREILTLVDYAHTPDALENVLTNARELVSSKTGRLIVVFGCGGDRDCTKRPLMGAIAGRLADVVVVTNDNPRTESPQSIIESITLGLRKEAKPYGNSSGYEIISDRREAINHAVAVSNPGDVLVVAGKGHEDYQIIGSERLHFDDREVLREIFSSGKISRN